MLYYTFTAVLLLTVNYVLFRIFHSISSLKKSDNINTLIDIIICLVIFQILYGILLFIAFQEYIRSKFCTEETVTYIEEKLGSKSKDNSFAKPASVSVEGDNNLAKSIASSSKSRITRQKISTSVNRQLTYK